MKTILGITWNAPEHICYLVACVSVLGSVVVLYRLYKTRSRAVLLQGKGQVPVLIGYWHHKYIVKALLFNVGLLSIALTLMHPQWNRKEETIMQEGRDLFVALDISRSMLAQDCSPSRLQCAKEKIKQLLSMLACERVGLILFSGSAFVQCPLTSDYRALYLFLEQVDAETISSGTTALDQALAQAIKSFAVFEQQKNKILVIFTDGEDFSSNLHANKEKAQEMGLHIFTIGVGTEQGAPVPLFNQDNTMIGHQRDDKGNVVISRLNKDILQALSSDAGGVYIPMTADNQDLRSLVRHVQKFEKEKIEEKKVSHLEEQYPYFLAIGLLCLLVEWLL